MNYGIIEKEVKVYVTELHQVNEGRSLPFHNLSRTNEITKAVKKMASHYHIDDRSCFIVVTAALFSQCGYVIETWDNAVAKSIDIATAFLTQAQVPPQDITAIADCIKAGAGVNKPAHFLEGILCDANTYYFGTADFKSYNKLRRKEHDQVNLTQTPASDWVTQSVEMLENHEYYTDYCISLLGVGKLDSIQGLKQRQLKYVAEILKEEQAGELQIDDTTAIDSITKKQKPEKEKAPVRGIEMMFRTSSTNNVRISIMADNKANIMITVNSIIISVVLGLIVKNLDTQRYLIIPSLLLLTVNVTTIIYSVLATRPNVGPGLFSEEQVKNKTINLLYFGSFFNMPFDDYTHAMKQVMTDSEFLYGCLMKDLYWQGKVLGRKYKLLRKAYTTFLFGIIAAVIAFAVAGLFFS